MTCKKCGYFIACPECSKYYEALESETKLCARCGGVFKSTTPCRLCNVCHTRFIQKW